MVCGRTNTMCKDADADAWEWDHESWGWGCECSARDGDGDMVSISAVSHYLSITVMRRKSGSGSNFRANHTGTTQHHPCPATCLSACLQDAMPQLFCGWLSDIAQLQPVFWFDALLVCVTARCLLCGRSMEKMNENGAPIQARVSLLFELHECIIRVPMYKNAFETYDRRERK